MSRKRFGSLSRKPDDILRRDWYDSMEKGIFNGEKERRAALLLKESEAKVDEEIKIQTEIDTIGESMVMLKEKVAGYSNALLDIYEENERLRLEREHGYDKDPIVVPYVKPMDFTGKRWLWKLNEISSRSTHILVCIHGIGGSPLIFKKWAHNLTLAGIELWAACLPGRCNRVLESCGNIIQDYAESILEAMLDLNLWKPGHHSRKHVVIFGHDLGGLIGYEIQKIIQSRYTDSEDHHHHNRIHYLVISGCVNPCSLSKYNRDRFNDKISVAKDGSLLRKIVSMEGKTHADIGLLYNDIFNSRFLRMSLKTIRNDFLAWETYWCRGFPVSSDNRFVNINELLDAAAQAKLMVAIPENDGKDGPSTNVSVSSEKFLVAAKEAIFNPFESSENDEVVDMEDDEEEAEVVEEEVEDEQPREVPWEIHKVKCPILTLCAHDDCPVFASPNAMAQWEDLTPIHQHLEFPRGGHMYLVDQKYTGAVCGLLIRVCVEADFSAPADVSSILNDDNEK